MANIDEIMDVQQKEDQQQKPLNERENISKNPKNKNSSNISIINTASFLGKIRKEAQTTRETVQKSHDFIREAMISMKKEIVNDVLQELNPRLNELEDLLKEVKNDKPPKMVRLSLSQTLKMRRWRRSPTT